MHHLSIKAVVLSWAILVVWTTPTFLFGQGNLTPAQRMEVLREAKVRYTDAESYYDRGAVRVVRMQLDGLSASEAEADHQIGREENTMFETTYRKNGDLRLLVAKFGEGPPALHSFRRFSGSVGFRSSGGPGVDPSQGYRTRGFFGKISDVFTTRWIDANEVPRLVANASGFHRPTVFPANPSVEEAIFNGVAVYEISGVHRSHFVTHWVERQTLMIVGVERVRTLGTAEAMVISTLYKPKRNLPLQDSDFADVGAEDLIYDPSEWQFPSLDVVDLREKADRIQEFSGTAPSPEVVVDRPESSPPPPPPPPVVRQSSVPTNTAEPVLEQQLSPEEMASVVLIEGEDGHGTGFITRINGLSFVITNLHVLADTETLQIQNFQGKTVTPRSIHAGRGYDIALIRIDDVEGGLTMTGDASQVSIGDKVVVVGNRLGGGVLTQEEGSVLGVGPDRVEVNAKFQPGNSGSPIVHLETGEVIGIATYLQEVSVVDERSASSLSSDKPSRGLSTRWFGYRFDSIKEWERIEWEEWRRQGKLVREFAQNSEVLLNLLRDERTQYMANPTLRSLVEQFERQVERASRRADIERHNRNLMEGLLEFCENDATNFEGEFYDYFHTSVYFDTSIPLQRQFRQLLKKHLEQSRRDHAFRSR